jgi:hypothetical protein
VKENGGNDYEHRSTGVGVRKAHFGEPVHPTPETQSYHYQKDQNDVLDDAAVGFVHLALVKPVLQEIQKEDQEDHDEDQIENREHFDLEALLFDDADIVPNDFAGLRAVLAVSSVLVFVGIAEEHFQLYPFVYSVQFVNFLSGCDVVEHYDSSVAIVVKGVFHF